MREGGTMRAPSDATRGGVAGPAAAFGAGVAGGVVGTGVADVVTSTGGADVAAGAATADPTAISVGGGVPRRAIAASTSRRTMRPPGPDAVISPMPRPALAGLLRASRVAKILG